MVFKNFYLQTGLRLLFLIATAITFTWLMATGHKLIFTINLAALLILQVVSLFWFLNRWNRELYDFFRGLKESSYEIPRHLGWQWLRPMEQPLTELKDHLRKQQEQKEIENEYFRVMSEQVSTGILVFDEKWDVRFSNKAALGLLDIEAIRNIFSLERKQPEITRLLQGMLPGASTEFVLRTDNNPRTLMIKTSEFITAQKRYKVFVFDNIQQVINRKEVESWQKLIRVLNHEIMNSIGPINSTTEMLIQKWEKKAANDEEQKYLASKTIRGLEVIGERSRSLADFVGAYRSLTKIPKPEIQAVNLKNLVEEVCHLFEGELDKTDIIFNQSVDGSIQLNTDPAFVQQILINLIKNAIEAFDEEDGKDCRIEIQSGHLAKQAMLTIKDNGRGMDANVLENAFVPFFTTKETGSGVGLSLARQLMFSMEGSLEISSRAGQGTEVRLLF